MSAQAIEVVQNLVLDTISPYIKRIEALEADMAEVLTTPQSAQEPKEGFLAHEMAQIAEVAQSPLQARLDLIVDMHRMDAIPALWVFNNGKREQAPEGLWEISCSVCKDHTITWREGQSLPQRCKTVRAALGEA